MRYQKQTDMKKTYITIVYILDGTTTTKYGIEWYNSYGDGDIITRNRIKYTVKCMSDTYTTEKGTTAVKHVILKPI